MLSIHAAAVVVVIVVVGVVSGIAQQLVALSAAPSSQTVKASAGQGILFS